MVSTNRLSTGVQYAVKSMFDRSVYYQGQKYNNPRESSKLLATSLLANTGASSGSLSRIARGPGNINRLKGNILLSYQR